MSPPPANGIDYSSRPGEAAVHSRDTDTLRTLAGHPAVFTRVAVAGNPATPLDVLRMLAYDRFIPVAASVAANPNTPTGVLTTLASSRRPGVRAAVAANPSTSDLTRALLVVDTSERVRKALTNSSHTTAQLLAVLAQDTCRDVQLGALHNPNTPVSVIEQSAQGPDEYVARVASSMRRSHLSQYAHQLPEPARTHARLLIESGFLGWPRHLSTVLSPHTQTSAITRLAHQRGARAR